MQNHYCKDMSVLGIINKLTMHLFTHRRLGDEHGYNYDYPLVDNWTNEDIVKVESILADTAAYHVISSNIEKGPLKVLFSTPGSLIIQTDDMKVIKVYTDTKNSKDQFTVELMLYQSLKEMPCVPRLYGFLNTTAFKFIIVDFCGVDLLELVTKVGMTFGLWKQCICQISQAITKLHHQEHIHGDIKLENITYDGDQFYMIDFGYSYISNARFGRYSGTFPNIVPFYGIKRRGPLEEAFAKLPVMEQRRISDIYAFALTMLNIVSIGFVERCENCISNDKMCEQCKNFDIPAEKVKYARMDIEKLIKCRFNKDTDLISWGKQQWGWDVIHILIDIVLTQINKDYKYVIWDKNKHLCHYVGINKLNYMVSENIFKLWESLIIYTNN